MTICDHCGNRHGSLRKYAATLQFEGDPKGGISYHMELCMDCARRLEENVKEFQRMHSWQDAEPAKQTPGTTT
jgi:hypothetical protein